MPGSNQKIFLPLSILICMVLYLKSSAPSPPAHRPSDQSKNKQLKQAASGRRRKNESIRHPFSQITPPTFVKLKGQSIESSSFIIKRSCAVKKSVIYIDFTTY
jgi:hypothetical protein